MIKGKIKRIDRRIRRLFVPAVCAACLLAGCSSTVQDGTEALEAGNYDEAIALFQEAASDDNRETAAQGYRGLGMAYYEKADYASALTAFQSVLDNGGKQTPQIYNLMGVCAMQTEDYAGALSYFQSGIALAEAQEGTEGEEGTVSEELFQEMRYNEIICCERQGDWSTARSRMAAYLEDYPDDEAAQKEAVFLESR